MEDRAIQQMCVAVAEHILAPFNSLKSSTAAAATAAATGSKGLSSSSSLVGSAQGSSTSDTSAAYATPQELALARQIAQQSMTLYRLCHSHSSQQVPIVITQGGLGMEEAAYCVCAVLMAREPAVWAALVRRANVLLARRPALRLGSPKPVLLKIVDVTKFAARSARLLPALATALPGSTSAVVAATTTSATTLTSAGVAATTPPPTSGSIDDTHAEMIAARFFFAITTDVERSKFPQLFTSMLIATKAEEGALRKSGGRRGGATKRSRQGSSSTSAGKHRGGGGGRHRSAATMSGEALASLGLYRADLCRRTAGMSGSMTGDRGSGGSGSGAAGGSGGGGGSGAAEDDEDANGEEDDDATIWMKWMARATAAPVANNEGHGTASAAAAAAASALGDAWCPSESLFHTANGLNLVTLAAEAAHTQRLLHWQRVGACVRCPLLYQANALAAHTDLNHSGPANAFSASFEGGHLIAHEGLQQPLDREEKKEETCLAQRQQQQQYLLFTQALYNQLGSGYTRLCRMQFLEPQFYFLPATSVSTVSSLPPPPPPIGYEFVSTESHMLFPTRLRSGSLLPRPPRLVSSEFLWLRLLICAMWLGVYTESVLPLEMLADAAVAAVRHSGGSSGAHIDFHLDLPDSNDGTHEELRRRRFIQSTVAFCIRVVKEARALFSSSSPPCCPVCDTLRRPQPTLFWGSLRGDRQVLQAQMKPLVRDLAQQQRQWMKRGRERGRRTEEEEEEKVDEDDHTDRNQSCRRRVTTKGEVGATAADTAGKSVNGCHSAQAGSGEEDGEEEEDEDSKLLQAWSSFTTAVSFDQALDALVRASPIENHSRRSTREEAAGDAGEDGETYRQGLGLSGPLAPCSSTPPPPPPPANSDLSAAAAAAAPETHDRAREVIIEILSRRLSAVSSHLASSSFCELHRRHSSSSSGNSNNNTTGARSGGPCSSRETAISEEDHMLQLVWLPIICAASSTSSSRACGKDSAIGKLTLDQLVSQVVLEKCDMDRCAALLYESPHQQCGRESAVAELWRHMRNEGTAAAAAVPHLGDFSWGRTQASTDILHKIDSSSMRARVHQEQQRLRALLDYIPVIPHVREEDGVLECARCFSLFHQACVAPTQRDAAQSCFLCHVCRLQRGALAPVRYEFASSGESDADED